MGRAGHRCCAGKAGGGEETHKTPLSFSHGCSRFRLTPPAFWLSALVSSGGGVGSAPGATGAASERWRCRVMGVDAAQMSNDIKVHGSGTP